MIIKGKRARITPDGRAYIFARSLQLPRVPRTKLAESLQDEIKGKGQDVPEIEVLERMISKARNHPVSKLDAPWNISSLVEGECDIPPEALPKVIELFVEKILSEGVHLTIREAKWVARLAFIPQSLETLYAAALEYAQAEKASLALGVDMAQIMEDDILLFQDTYSALGKPLTEAKVQTLRLRIKYAQSKVELNKTKEQRKGGTK